MSRRWVKTYATLLDSSVYLQPCPTRVLWEVMRLEADRLGRVMHNEITLARRAHLALPEVKAGLAFLASPDPASRDPERDGRMIEPIPGGWQIVNHDKHQSGTSTEQKEFARARSARYRARKRAARDASRGVTRDASAVIRHGLRDASRVSVTTLEVDINQKLLDPSRDHVTRSEEPEAKSVTRDAREARHLDRIRALLEGESGSPEESEKRDEQKRESGRALQ